MLLGADNHGGERENRKVQPRLIDAGKICRVDAIKSEGHRMSLVYGIFTKSAIYTSRPHPTASFSLAINQLAMGVEKLLQKVFRTHKDTKHVASASTSQRASSLDIHPPSASIPDLDNTQISTPQGTPARTINENSRHDAGVAESQSCQHLRGLSRTLHRPYGLPQS